MKLSSRAKSRYAPPALRLTEQSNLSNKFEFSFSSFGTVTIKSKSYDAKAGTITHHSCSDSKKSSGT